MIYTYIACAGDIDAEALHEPEYLLVGLLQGRRDRRDDGADRLRGIRHPAVPLYLRYRVTLARLQHQHLPYQALAV